MLHTSFHGELSSVSTPKISDANIWVHGCTSDLYWHTVHFAGLCLDDTVRTSVLSSFHISLFFSIHAPSCLDSLLELLQAWTELYASARPKHLVYHRDSRTVTPWDIWVVDAAINSCNQEIYMHMLACWRESCTTLESILCVQCVIPNNAAVVHSGWTISVVCLSLFSKVSCLGNTCMSSLLLLSVPQIKAGVIMTITAMFVNIMT